jgi:glycosyltransferase involved in cell wall biosynthesis
LTATFLPTLGGAERVLDGLARSLGESGHEATVLAPHVRGDQALSPPPYRLVRYRRPSSKRLGVRQLLVRLLWEHWRRPADVLHCHGAYPPGFVGLTFRRLTGVPVVVRPHGSDILPGEHIRRHRRLGERVARVMREADAVIAQGRELAQEAEALGAPAPRIRLIANGVEIPPAMERRAADPPILLALGSLTPKKGFDILLRAFAGVRAAVPGVRLVLAGEGPEGERLRALAQELGLGDGVAFPGQVVGEAKAALFAQAALAVVPSRREPFSNALLELLASGCPVVATAVGGTPEILGDPPAGVLVPPEDPASLAEAVLELLRDSERREALGMMARARATQFSWSHMVEQYLEVYRSVAGES